MLMKLLILISYAEDVINGGLVLLFDAVVVVITLYYTWNEAKKVKGVFQNQRDSLTVIFVHQGTLSGLGHHLFKS